MKQATFKLFFQVFATSLALTSVSAVNPVFARELPPTLMAQGADPGVNLSVLERQVLEEMNRARTNPVVYADWLESMKQYYNGNLLQLPGQPPIQTQEGVSAVDEAIVFLRSVPPLLPLRPSLGMSLGAKDHVNDIGSRGTIGHYGSDGSQFLERINRYGSSSGEVGENITYGVTTAQAIVMQLVVDDGVAERFHRDNIFYERFSVTGIACGPHQRYQQMCAIAYSGDYRDNIAQTPNRFSENPSQPSNLTGVQVSDISSSPEVPAVEVAVETSPATPPVEETNPSVPPEVVPAQPPAETPGSEDITSPPPSPELLLPDETTDPPESSVNTVLKTEGTLEEGDLVYERDGSLYDVHRFEGKAGQSIKITVESNDFDTFLAVFDESDEIVGQNDDLAENITNSSLEISLPHDGVYRIFINGYGPEDRGRYTVTVTE